MRDQKDRLPLFCVQPVEDIHDHPACRGVEGAGRFVSEDNRRIIRHCPRNRNSLLLASRELVRTVIHPVLHTDELQKELGALFALRRRHARVQKRNFHVLPRAHSGNQVIGLKNKPDLSSPDRRAGIVRQAADINSQKVIVSLRRPVQNTDDVHERTLAGAGFSDDRGELAFLHIEVDSMQNFEFILGTDIIFLNDFLKMNNAVHTCLRFSRRCR